jgi:hypothetical protein
MSRAAVVTPALVGLCVTAAAGCSAVHGADRPNDAFAQYVAAARRVGPGSRFRPLARDFAVQRGRNVAGMRCLRAARVFGLAHVELFAEGHVVVVPAGIGIAPPVRRRGAYVLGGRCGYPIQTREPTGLLLLARRNRYSVGALFAVWGRQLGRSRLLSFAASGHDAVSVYIDGRRWAGAPAAAPLRPGSQVTIEIGAFVPPHRDYRFPRVRAALR